jgi:CBS domain containing-hemolysin-like protein
VVGAQAALSLLANPERLLSVVQVGVTFASLALGWVGEDTLFELLQAAFRPLLGPSTEVVLHGICLVVAFTAMSFAHVVIGEVVPKNIAIDKAERLAALVAPALLVFYKLTEPFVWAIERASAAVSRLLGVKGEPRGGGHSAEELKFIVRSSLTSGALGQFEEQAIQGLLELGDYAVREVMTPRNALVMVPAEAGLDEVLKLMSETRYSRLPVYEDSREKIVGVVHAKDVLEYWTVRRQSMLRRQPAAEFRLRKIMREAPVFPETKPLNQALDELRQALAHAALVVDEFGTIVGLVTLDDILERVVGEIRDEFDAAAPLLAEPAAAALEVDGTTSLVDLDEQHGVQLPADLGVETLAGFLMYRLGRLPAAGDAVEEDGRRYTVLEMEFHRVARVRVEKLAGPPARQG